MTPLVALAGTIAVIFVGELTTKEAEVPLKLVAVTPVKLSPLIVTDVPTCPPVGVKPEITGAAVKEPALDAVPAGV